jgi:hypothetical protein
VKGLLSCVSCPQSLAAFVLQNRAKFPRLLVGFAAKTCSGSPESIVATYSYCSTTSLSILAVRVLGHLSAFLSTFRFFDWFVLGCKTLI